MARPYSREIVALRRNDRTGIFEFWADGKLIEEYEANEDTYHALLPVKLWRTFNKVLDSRIAQIKEDAKYGHCDKY